MKNNINERMTALETAFEERWEAHDIRSKENWDDMKEHLNKLSNKMDKVIETASNLPCGEMREKLHGFNVRLGWVWTVVISVILMGIVFGFWMKTAEPKKSSAVNKTSYLVNNQPWPNCLPSTD